MHPSWESVWILAPKLLRKKLLNGERDPVLHQAAKKGNAALVKIFLQYDADPWPMRKLTRTCSGCVFFYLWNGYGWPLLVFDYATSRRTVAKIRIGIMFFSIFFQNFEDLNLLIQDYLAATAVEICQFWGSKKIRIWGHQPPWFAWADGPSLGHGWRPWASCMGLDLPESTGERSQQTAWL